MDYEKEYKDALERMKSWAKCEHPECFTEAQRAAEFIFPELKENEDGKNKRISKEITQFLKKNNGWNREWLNWLEKQGRQKSMDDLTPQEAMDIAVAKCFDEQKPADKVEPKLGQPEVTKTSDQEIGIAEIPFGAKDSELQEAIYNIPKGFHAEIENDRIIIRKSEQKTIEWSEEDECYMTECINAIATKDGWSFEEKRETKHWLKSLKERIGG